MNVDHISGLLRKKFETVEEVRPNLIRAEYCHNKKPVRVCYFDFNNEILNPEFDWQKYQDDLLSADYYTHPGSLQWNFYLYFVYDAKNAAGLSLARKYQIESDKDYAKKHVVSESELEKEYAKKQYRYALHEDLGNRWIKKLQQYSLDAVYLKNISRDDVVEKYLNGDPILDSEEDNIDAYTDIKNHVDILKHIKVLELSNFREFPKEKEFEFGLCNLIEGVNGTGKTSLLEAIELWVCGQTRRNKKQPAELKIGVKYSSAENFNWNELNNNAFYAERDLKWYKNSYKKGNRLAESFERYNFYNSDTATSFELANEMTGIDKAITNLITSEVVSIIDERLQPIKMKFSREHEKCRQQKEKILAEIQGANEKFKIFEKPLLAEDGDAYNHFLKQLDKNGWAGIVPANEGDSLNDFSNELSILSAKLEHCLALISHCESSSVDGLERECAIINGVVSQLEHYSSEMKANHNSIVQARAENEVNASVLKLLKNLKKYIIEPDMGKIYGLTDLIELKQGESTVYKDIIDRVKHIDLARYQQSKDNICYIDDVIAQKEYKLKELMMQEESTSEKIEVFKKRDGAILRYISEIRSIGRELISVNKHIKDCPLCGAHYDLGTLAKKIEALNGEAISLNKDEELFAILRDIQTEIDSVASEVSDLLQIKNFFRLSSTNEDNNKTLGVVVENLLNLNEKTAELQRELSYLLALWEYFESKDLTEEELLTLEQQLSCYDLKIGWENLGREKFESVYNLYKENHEKSLKIIFGLQKKQSAIGNDKRTYLQEYFKSPFPELFDVTSIYDKKKNIELALTIIENDFMAYINSSSESLRDLELSLKKIKFLYDDFFRMKTILNESIFLRQETESIKASLNKEFEFYSERESRAAKALKGINDLECNENKLCFFEKFIDENLEEIASIFRQIHSPKEFSEVIFINNRIKLKREGFSVDCEISEISTGQRAALVLSIFLTLNKKLKHGPPYIIFDDPVAYIDDLNILSFLDYLREYVLEHKRQLFFATANQKVASLFKRKFDFLGDDFKCFNLTRDIADPGI